jgi:hypothetical protein
MSKPTFEQGYVCAVAQIVQLHGETTIAKDVLAAAGKIDWSQVDGYDSEILQKAGLAPPQPAEPK